MLREGFDTGRKWEIKKSSCFKIAQDEVGTVRIIIFTLACKMMKIGDLNTKLPIKKLEGKTIKDVLKLEKPLGEGKYGTVYEAQKKVAVKEIQIKDTNQLRYLVTEIEALHLARNCDKYTNELYDVLYDENKETFYFVMELIRGKELQDWIKEHPIQTEEDALKILIPLKEGLDCLHENGIAHRDIKAQNVMVSDNEVKWIDFGLSCIGECRPSVVGNLAHMAPEILMVRRVRDVEAWIVADLWSFGCLAFKLVTGKIMPFQLHIARTYSGGSAVSKDFALTYKPLEYKIDSTLKEKLERFPKVEELLQACLTVNTAIRKYTYEYFNFFRKEEDSNAEYFFDLREQNRIFRFDDDSSTTN